MRNCSRTLTLFNSFFLIWVYTLSSGPFQPLLKPHLLALFYPFLFILPYNVFLLSEFICLYIFRLMFLTATKV